MIIFYMVMTDRRWKQFFCFLFLHKISDLTALGQVGCREYGVFDDKVLGGKVEPDLDLVWLV